MKRLLTICMLLMMSLAVVGCSKDKKEDEGWIKDSADMITDEITSGQFVLDGVVYEFPMPLQDWLDNGWELSNSYENIDDFMLKPGYSSTSFELFNEDDAYVRVTVFNDSEEEANVKDCMVDYLYMSLTEVDVVFPQGMTKRNKPDEILEAYGDPISKGDEADRGYIEALYQYTNDDAVTCYVELGIADNSYTIDPFSSVEYSVLSSSSVMDALIREEGEEAAVNAFLDATMKAAYYGEFEDYTTKYCIDSLSGAEDLYQSEVDAYASFLMYYVDVYEDYNTDEINERFEEIAKAVLSEVKWEVKEVEVDVFGEGTVTIDLYPTDFIYVIEDDVYDALDEFYTKYEDADFDAMSDEEYAEVELTYTTLMLEAMEKNVDKAGTLDPVERVYDLDMNDSYISNDDWFNMDDVIMDLYDEDAEEDSEEE